MSTQRFSRGKQITWHGTDYEVGSLREDSLVAVLNLATNETNFVNMDELVRDLFNGQLTFIAAERENPPAVPQNIDLSSYTEHQRTVAQYRLSVIQPLCGLSGKERTSEAIRRYIAALQQEEVNPTGSANKLSVASIYRWLDAYQNSGEDIRSLIPNSQAQGGKDKIRLNSDADAIVAEVLKELYLTRTSVTIDMLLWEIADRIRKANNQQPGAEPLKMPSRATIGRRIQKMDFNVRLTAKKGKHAAQRLTTQYNESTAPTFVLQRVEIDHTVLDLLVIDPQDNLILGRPTLTFCLDVASCVPAGYSISFEPPSYGSVMDCLVQSISPKDELCQRYALHNRWPIYGIPYTLVTDNGREFIGNDLADACQCLGITLEHMPPRTPQFKGTIERHLGTIEQMLIHGIPGTTFSNIQQRGDYNSVEYACITIEDLDKALCIYLVDVYSQRFHKGIETTPASKFQALTRDGFAPRLPQSINDLSVLLGRTLTRTIQPYGIEFEGLRYNCSGLSSLRVERKTGGVRVKYDPHDLSHIYVFDEHHLEYIEVPSLAQNYTRGLSLWKHRVIRAFARDEFHKVDMAALGQAMQRIREIVEAGRARQKTVAGKRVGRWSGGKTQPGLPADQSSSPVVSPVSTAKPNKAAPKTEHAEDVPDWLAEADSDQWGFDYSLPTTQDSQHSELDTDMEDRNV